ncbi:hypothetical protein N7461_002173 [Penicillium sp. DV-2018c]|nr:hypothetical protein N7461_002173 [Penicillium sp. DV-2018c]
MELELNISFRRMWRVVAQNEPQTTYAVHQSALIYNENPVFWNRDPGELELYRGPSPNCGPWRDLTSYCRGLIDTGLSRFPKEEVNDLKPLPYQGSIQDHTRLLKTIREVIQKLVEGKRIADAATPALLHSDSHKRNIYVSAKDPTVITGLIDWKSTSIKPAFIYADETPDFAEPPRVPVEDLSENEQNERELSKEQERD